MKLIDVMRKYHKLVPFPVTPESIASAGYDVCFYLSRLCEELSSCDDFASNKMAQKIVKSLNKLKKQ